VDNYLSISQLRHTEWSYEHGQGKQQSIDGARDCWHQQQQQQQRVVMTTNNQHAPATLSAAINTPTLTSQPASATGY